MSYDDHETSTDELEHHYYQGLDADLEMSEMVQAAWEMEAMRNRGECPHSSGIGYVSPAVHPQAAHLLPGQFLCTDICGETIPDPFWTEDDEHFES